MIPAQVQVELDDQAIKQYIQNQLDNHLRLEYIFVDVNKLAELMSVSKRWLEEHVLNEPRVMIHLRQKNRKRLYVYPEVVEAIKSISDEW